MEDSELLNILHIHNPWWTGKNQTLPSKKRGEYFTLQTALWDKQITAIIGPRRTGKSIIMQQLIQQLLVEKTNQKNILFTQLDESLFVTEKNTLIQHIITVYAKYILSCDLNSLPEKIYIFFDEIQQVDKWSEALKSYYDKGYQIKFIVSGSSAAGITRGSSESLAGRVSINILPTLKFADYLRFRNLNDELDKQTQKLQTILTAAFRK